MRHDDAASPIRVRVTGIAQLFGAANLNPFGGKNLDEDADDYIVGQARELPRQAPIRIVIHLPPSEAASPEAQAVPADMARYFGRRADQAKTELRQLFRVGRKSLVIGLAVLAACLAATQAFPGTGVVKESLVILGWVAGWKPIGIFLYDWWPIAHRRDLYQRLASATIEVRKDAERPPQAQPDAEGKRAAEGW